MSSGISLAQGASGLNNNEAAIDHDSAIHIDAITPLGSAGNHDEATSFEPPLGNAAATNNEPTMNHEAAANNEAAIHQEAAANLEVSGASLKTYSSIARQSHQTH